MKKLSSIQKILLLLAILVIPSVGYLLLTTGKHNFKPLGIYGPKDEIAANGDTIYHTIPPFSFVNQQGEKMSSQDLEGKIYVASFFFANCKGICPKINSQLQRVQEKYKAQRELRIISFSVDPERDSVEVLDRLGRQFLVNPRKWSLLTGDKKEIYDLARYGFLATAMEGDGGSEDFIHSEFLVLVDKDKRIRGFYDGTSPKDVDRLIDEIMVLMMEYKEKR